MFWLPLLASLFLLLTLPTSDANHKPETAKPHPLGTLAAVLTQQWMRWTGLNNNNINNNNGKPASTKIHHQMVPEKRLGSFDLPQSKPTRMTTTDPHRQGIFYAGIVEDEPGSPNYLPPPPSYSSHHHSAFNSDLRESPNYYGPRPNYPPNPVYEPHYPPPPHDNGGRPPHYENTQYSPMVVEGTFGRPVVMDPPHWQSSSQFPKPIPPIMHTNSDMFKGFHDTQSPLMGSASTMPSSSGSQSLWQVVDVATAMKPMMSSSSNHFQQQQHFLDKKPPHFKSINGHRVIDTLDPAFLAWALHRTKKGKKVHDSRQNSHRANRPVVVVVTGSNLPSSILADQPSLSSAIGGKNTNSNGGKQVLLHVDLDKSTIRAITPQTLQHLGLTANARPATTIHLHRPPGLGQHTSGGFGVSGLGQPSLGGFGGTSSLLSSGGGFGGLGSSGGLSSGGGGFNNLHGSNSPGFRNPILLPPSFANSPFMPPPHSFVQSNLASGSGKPNSSPFPISGGLFPSGTHNNLQNQPEFGHQSSPFSDILTHGPSNTEFGVNGFQDGPMPFANPNDLGSFEPFSELIDDEDEEWSVFPLPSSSFLGSGISDNFDSSSSPLSSILSQFGSGGGGLFSGGSGDVFGGGGHNNGGSGGIFGGGHNSGGSGGIFGGGHNSGGSGGIFGSGISSRPLSALAQLQPHESKRLRDLLARILKPFVARYKLVIGPSGLEPSAFMNKHAENRKGAQTRHQNGTAQVPTNNSTTVVTTVIANVTQLDSPNSRSILDNSTALLDNNLQSIITPRR